MNDIQFVVGDGEVVTHQGHRVVFPGSERRVVRRQRLAVGGNVVSVEGTAALYASVGTGVFGRLVEAIPAALLLQHRALRDWAPITLIHDGTAGLAEEFLLGCIENPQVRLEAMGPGSIAVPERAALPSPVGRTHAGALTRWYRRWVDREAGKAGDSPAARRIVVRHGPGDPLMRHPMICDAIAGHGLVTLDTLTGALGDSDTLDAAKVVALLRDAHLVLGVSDDALAHAVFARRASILQIAPGETVSPRTAQLAASRALPYQYVPLNGLEWALETILE
ncbi:MAG: hypothetical protein ACK5O2_02215 [Microthrixaceae bacterium]